MGRRVERDVTTQFVGGYARSRSRGPLRHSAPAADSGATSETTDSAERHRSPHYASYAFLVKNLIQSQSTVGLNDSVKVCVLPCNSSSKLAPAARLGRGKRTVQLLANTRSKTISSKPVSLATTNKSRSISE